MGGDTHVLRWGIEQPVSEVSISIRNIFPM